MQLAPAAPVTPVPDGEPRRAPDGAAERRTWFDRIVDPVRWEPVHQRLAAQPLFASCSRSEIRQLARAGDECLVPAGTVLCRAGRIGYWLFVVISGSIVVRDGSGDGSAGVARAGAGGTVLGAGSHFGDVAIVGFGPQPFTAEVVEDATLFVLGRRHVLGLIHTMPGFRAGLFPGVSEPGLRALLRDLRHAGMAGWHALPRRVVDAIVAEDGLEQRLPALMTVPRVRATRGGSSSSASQPSLSALALLMRPGGAGSAVALRAPVVVRPLDRRVVAGMVAVVMAAMTMFAFSYHPDVLVVRPSRPIDVSSDIAIAVGASRSAPVALHAPRGRYILTAVDIEETTLAGLALAVAQGHDTLPRVQGEAAVEESRAGRERYQQSQRVALDLVARRAGIDPATLVVRFRDRGLAGPSAGLVYALVLADMADVVAVPPGRVIAATGELAPDGRIRAVGFIAMKREVAEGSGAALFLMPMVAGRGGGPSSPGTVSVATLDEALAAVGS
jgi:CRP-like cAMP-binding protein